MSKGTLDIEAAARSPLPVGQCHLLAIAIDDYTEAPLYNCVSDAEAVAKALQTHYGFSTDHIRFLRNAEADAEAIYVALEYYAQHLTEHDSLIIYFSGHGKLHEQLGDGYWLPAGCQFHKYRSQGIPNDEIRKRIALQKARHVLLLVDSCFAGSLFAHKNASDGTGRDPHAAERYKSRWAITAGRQEPVSDGKPGQQSPFAQYLLQYLEKDGEDSFTAAELGEFLITAVSRNAPQEPVSGPLQFADDKNGRFVFRRVPLERADTLAFKKAKASGDLDELELFLDEHENSPHKPEAKRLIKGIEELHVWQQAEKEHSIASYDDYLDQYPHGIEAEMAKQRKRNLAEQKRRSRAEAEGLRLAEEDARHATHCDGPNLPIMVFVKGGKFDMGSNKDDREKPIHEVAVSNFFIGQYPVTFEEYDAFCEATQREKPSTKWGRGRRPVINVSWEDADAYCQWLSSLTKNSYRLPTEAEWEYAARGGEISKGFEYAGSNNLDEVGWYAKPNTRPVGDMKPNELDLYDMSGNVWEWCQDVWHGNYEGAPIDGKAWMTGGNSKLAVLRGGSWCLNDYDCRVAVRTWCRRLFWSTFNGFRLVKDD